MVSSEEVPLVPAEPEQARGKRWGATAAVLSGAALVVAGVRGVGFSSQAEAPKSDLSAVTDLFAAEPALCTDGTTFSFSMDLASSQGQPETLLSTTNGATSVVLSNGVLAWKVDTFNYGSVNVTMDAATASSATFAKTRDQLCIEASGIKKCQTIPTWMPISNFQMKSLGQVVLGRSVRSFKQVSGSVPITFSLQNLDMQKLWNNDVEWNSVVDRLQEMLAALVGKAMHWDARVTPVAPTKGHKGVIFQGSVDVRHGSPCEAQEKLQDAIQGEKGLSDSLFASAVVERIAAAKLASSNAGLVVVGSATVPASSTACSDLLCRKNFPRKLPENAQCLGGVCSHVCCGSKLAEPLPFFAEGDAPVVVDAILPESAPTFVMPDLVKEAMGRGMLAVPSAKSVRERELLFPKDGKKGGQKDGKKGSQPPKQKPTRPEPDYLEGSFTLTQLTASDLSLVPDMVSEALSKMIKGIDTSSISVTVSTGKAKSPHKTIGLPKPTKEEKEAQAEFKKMKDAIMSGKPYGGLVDDETVNASETKAREGKPLVLQLQEMGIAVPGMRRLEMEEEAAKFEGDQEAEERELFGRGGTTTQVVFSVQSCTGDCKTGAVQILNDNSMGDHLNGLRFKSFQDFSCHCKPIACEKYTCSNIYATHIGDGEECYGDDCEEVCCKNPTCGDLECVGIEPITENDDLVCTSKEDCESTCCHFRCAQYECEEGSCNDPDAADLIVPPCHAQKFCCAPIKPCCSDIAWCKASFECMDVGDWCDAQEADRLLQADDRSLLAGETEGPRDPTVGVLPAMDLVASPKTGLRGAEAAKERLRSLKEAESDQLQLGFEGLTKEAIAFHEANSNVNAPRELRSAQVSRMLGLFHGKHCHTPKGCTSVAVGSCSYYFESLFCLHRGHSKKTVAVNTVQVLQDTVHAVSCGDDATCWVWKICSGKPRQRFVPKFSYGPIQTASVLFDGLRIVSAGMGAFFGGVAHVWEWRTGKAVACTKCITGPFLSSAEIPEWRTVLLGCGNGYTLKWNWQYDDIDYLPWMSRGPFEMIAMTMKLVMACKNKALAGVGALLKGEKYITQHKFLDAVLPEFPSIENSYKCLYFINDFFFGTSFGATKAVAYVPTYLRFVTGSADGRVRYWDSQTGVLLNVMRGHHGPVNAIVGSLVKQEAISGGEDGTLRVWCLEKGLEKFLFIQDYGGPIYSVAIYPANRIVVAGSADGYVRFWDLHSGMLLCAINTGGRGVNGVAINPSGPLGQILAAGADGYVRVFNPR